MSKKQTTKDIIEEKIRDLDSVISGNPKYSNLQISKQVPKNLAGVTNVTMEYDLPGIKPFDSEDESAMCAVWEPIRNEFKDMFKQFGIMDDEKPDGWMEISIGQTTEHKDDNSGKPVLMIEFTHVDVDVSPTMKEYFLNKVGSTIRHYKKGGLLFEAEVLAVNGDNVIVQVETHSFNGSMRIGNRLTQYTKTVELRWVGNLEDFWSKVR